MRPLPLAPRRLTRATKRRLSTDFLTNDGIVEGVWIFCRHGDRTPSRPLSAVHRRDEEAAFWLTRLPRPNTATVFGDFSRYFPPRIHPDLNEGSFLDTRRNPFGFLTDSGLHQLSETGRRFFNRYNHHGHHLPERLNWRHEYAEDFLSVWDVKVYSTNYLRTIMSVQSFLDGLLGTHAHDPSEMERSHDPNVFEEQPVPDHGWRRDDYASEELVPVLVRQLSHDPLNAFDRNPKLMSDLVHQVISKPDFQSGDATAIPLASRLANVLPGLVRRTNSPSSRSPSGINWVEAADHFVCRKAHGVDYAAFTDTESEHSQMLEALSHETLAHLAWRFRQWYKHPQLLAAVAAPPLREIATQVQETPTLKTRDKHPFVIYSCHDVTILGILYGMGADFLVDEWKSFWPTYGSTLVFELVRIPGEVEKYVVRVLLNGTPVRSVHGREPVGHGPHAMMWIDDFDEMVRHLEDQGGFDYDELLRMK